MFLTDLHRDCWKMLVSAPSRPKDGFKTFTLATLGPDSQPDARTVVLRRADETDHKIWFHTDRRAAKVAQLQAHAAATLLFWDAKRQVQLRLVADVVLHQADAEADAHWAKLWVGGRKMYLSEKTPGTALPEPYPGFPPYLGETLPSEAESEAGRANFVAVECRVVSLEYLKLGRAGQTRARFTYGPQPTQTWLAP